MKDFFKAVIVGLIMIAAGVVLELFSRIQIVNTVGTILVMAGAIALVATVIEVYGEKFTKVRKWEAVITVAIGAAFLALAGLSRSFFEGIIGIAILVVGVGFSAYVAMGKKLP